MQKFSFSFLIFCSIFYSTNAQLKTPYSSIGFHIGPSVIESKKFPVFHQPNEGGYDAKRLSLSISGGLKYVFTFNTNFSAGLLNDCDYFTINDGSYCLQNSIDAAIICNISRSPLYFPLEIGFTNLSYFSKKSYSGNGFNFSFGSGYSVSRILSITCSCYMYNVVFKNMVVDVFNITGLPVALISENGNPNSNAGVPVRPAKKDVSINYFEFAIHADVQIPCVSHHNQNQPRDNSNKRNNLSS